MLPGGLKIVGLYIFSENDSVVQNQSLVLRMYGSIPEHFEEEILILHVSLKTKKYFFFFSGVRPL